MKKILIIIAILLLAVGNTVAQKWIEKSGDPIKFDLSDKRILTVVYEGFNYEEAVEISNYWKSWGANVDIAGTMKEQNGEKCNPATGIAHDVVPVTLKTDMLLDIASKENYDLIYFPGGEGVTEFLKSKRDQIKELIDKGVEKGNHIAAICHSPYLLSASSSLKGHTITVQGHEFKPELSKAGASFSNDIFVKDGEFLTGQWPYFETFAVSVAEVLVNETYNSKNAEGESIKADKPEDDFLNHILMQRNTMMMDSGSIPDDSVVFIIRHSVNPVLPYGMMNNTAVRFIAVKDTALKFALADEIVIAGKEKYLQAKADLSWMRKFWANILNAPVIIFVFNDTASIISKDANKEPSIRLNTMLAGQSVSQMCLVAEHLGYNVSLIGNTSTLAAETGFKRVLSVPEDYQLINIIGIGKAVEITNPPVARPVSEYLTIK